YYYDCRGPDVIKLTQEERETIIRASAADRTWDIITADPRVTRRLQKKGYKPDDRKNPWGYVSFTVPFDRVKFLKAKKRKLSREHLEALARSREKPAAPSIV